MESERASPLSPGGPRQSAPYGHACVACAKAKCKCITRGPAGSTGSCERCTRLGRECRPSTSHRKRQVGVGGGGGGVDNRKAGSPRRSERDRTAQLEEKLEDLVRVLRAQAEAGEGANEERGSGRGRRKGSERSGDGFGPGTAMIMDELRGGAPMMASVTPIQDGASRHNPYIAARDKPTTADLMLTPAESTSPRAACGGGSSTAASSPVTASEIPSLSTVQAEETLALFREQYLRIFPFMHITPETSAATLQRERPYLWLNIRTLLAKSPLQQSALSLRCREILATKVFVDLERNMDLVLGLLVYAGWTMNHFCGKPLVVAAMNMGITLVGDLRLDRPIQDHPSKESNCFRNYTYPKCATGAVRTHEERRAVLAMWVVSLK
ncbi:hypothetical protein F5Y15DRAFT_336464 [Xylariaceae sp. FL0016]|nr:hypothetical protein F5Y15DRAFT_336464 [Xylariaceae sp. FL0016]